MICATSEHLFVREMDPPPQPPINATVEGKITGALGIFGKGSTKVDGQLLTPRAPANSEAMIKISIDNSSCQKMVTNIKFSVWRTITAYAKTINQTKKEFKDD